MPFLETVSYCRCGRQQGEERPGCACVCLQHQHAEQGLLQQARHTGPFLPTFKKHKNYILLLLKDFFEAGHAPTFCLHANDKAEAFAPLALTTASMQTPLPKETY